MNWLTQWVKESWISNLCLLTGNSTCVAVTRRSLNPFHYKVLGGGDVRQNQSVQW